MPRKPTIAQKVAEYDRRRSPEFRERQARAAHRLFAILPHLSSEDTERLRLYLEESEAEYRLVRNARFGGLTLEAADTPWHCSVQSDAYWQN